MQVGLRRDPARHVSRALREAAAASGALRAALLQLLRLEAPVTRGGPETNAFAAGCAALREEVGLVAARRPVQERGPSATQRRLARARRRMRRAGRL